MRDKTSPFYDVGTVQIDVGLRRYMQQVYAYMGGGLALTAVVAYFVQTSSVLMIMLFKSSLFLVIPFLQLGVCLYLGLKIDKMSSYRAQVLFWVYSILTGISLSCIFFLFAPMMIVTAFFITSSMFLALSIYGYVTDKDLSAMGTFLFMALIGLILASLVNIFAQSSGMSMIISVLGVMIFAGLTAYDVQSIKSLYKIDECVEIHTKKAIYGALRLYLDFINLFIHILSLLARSRD